MKFLHFLIIFGAALEIQYSLSTPLWRCVRVMRMCLVHDLAESIVGDITPHCGVSVEDKHQREITAMTSLAALPSKPAGEEMLALFKVFVDAARFVFSNFNVLSNRGAQLPFFSNLYQKKVVKN